MNALSAQVLLVLAEPEAEDVKAGWLAFGIFLLLIVGTVILCFSFVKQLRKAQAAKDAGVYGDKPVDEVDATDVPDSESGL